MKSRREDKYIFFNSDESLIVNDLTSKGCYLRKTASYRVSSVYYDSPLLTCAHENLLGLTPRSKYRLRVYGELLSPINVESENLFFEKKHKISSDVYKFRTNYSLAVPVNIKDYLSIDIKESFFGKDSIDQYNILVNYEPVLLVSYLRTRYISLVSNDEVTIDTELSFISATDKDRVIKRGDVIVLEHKYNKDSGGFLNVGSNLTRTRFSKYLYGLNQMGLLYEY